MQLKNKYFKFILVLFVLFAITDSLFLFAFPSILTPNVQNSLIKKLVDMKTFGKMEVEMLPVKTYSDFSIELGSKYIGLFDKNNNLIFSAENFNIKVPLVPLVFKQLYLNEFNIKRLSVNLDRDEKGKFNFEKLLKRQSLNKFDYTIRSAKCNIQDYNINFDDNYLHKQIFLNGSFFKINKFVQKKIVDVDVLGVITTDKIHKTPVTLRLMMGLPFKFNPGLSENLIEGYIENFNIEYFKPYLIKNFGKDIKTAKGIFSFEFHTDTTLNDAKKKIFTIKGAVDNLLIDKTSLKGIISSDKKLNLNFLLSVDENKLEWKKAQISSEKFNILSEGSVDFSGSEPELDINLNVPLSRTEEIVKILPANIVPKDSLQKDVIKTLKKYNIYGNIKGNVFIKGRAKKPDVTGYVLCDDVKLFSAKEPTHTATVDIKFQGDIMYLGVDVVLFNGEYTKVDGIVYVHSDGLNHFDIKTSDSLNLPLAQKIVLPIQDTFQFELGPIPYMPITQGTGNIDMKIDGTKEEGSIYGKAAFKNGSVGYYGLNGTIKDVLGEVFFEDKEVRYNADGYLDGYKVYLYGRSYQNSHSEINFGSNAIEAENVMSLINNSPLLSEIKAGMSALKEIKGKIKLDAMLRGDTNTLKVDSDSVENLTIRGSVYLFNNSFKLQNFNTPFESIKGIVEFSDREINFQNITALLGKSSFGVNGKILMNKRTKSPSSDIFVQSDSMFAGDTLRFIYESDFMKNKMPLKSFYNLDSVHDLKLTYKSGSPAFNINNIETELNFKPSLTKSPIYIATGNIKLKNSNITLNDIQGKFFNTVADFSGYVNKISAPEPVYNLGVKIKNFNFASLKEIENLNIIPKTIRNYILKFENFNGKLDLTLLLKNNNVKGDVDLSEVTFKNKKTGIVVTIPKNRIELKGNKLFAKSLDITVGQTPIFGDFAWTDIGNKNSINAHFATKFTDDILAVLLLSNPQNPIRVIGDAGFTIDIKGDINNLTVFSKLTFSPNSDLLYRNFSIGDCNALRELVAKINLKEDGIEIEKADVSKSYPSDKHKRDILSFKAKLDYFNAEMVPSSIELSIHENLPVRYLNPVFQTNLFSQGNVTGNIKYLTDEKKNGSLRGILHANNITLPGLSTTIDELTLNAESDNISVDLEGLVSKSDIKIHSDIENKFGYPINLDTLQISSNIISNADLFNALNGLRSEFVSVENANRANLTNKNLLNIREGQLKIDKFLYNNLETRNLTSDITLDDSNILEFKNIKAQVGDGKILAEGSYNFPTSFMSINVRLEDVASEDIAENFFGAKNQIYGKGYGKLNITTQGTESPERIKNLNGNCYFVIIDGRIPKLGSLEYLLRASNIVDSGVSGLTINGVLDLMNFSKNGNFSNINGEFEIKNGLVKDINLYSQGANLSMYLKGKYDIINSNAKIDIWGKLSNKIPTMLGPLGNTSINTFFGMIPGITPAESERREFNNNIDKIPALEYSNDDYKIFKAVIDGNINSNSGDFVKVFKWVQ